MLQKRFMAETVIIHNKQEILYSFMQEASSNTVGTPL